MEWFKDQFIIYALRAIKHLVGLLSSNTLLAVPLGQPESLLAPSILANRFSPQSTPTADAQAAQPTFQVVGDAGTRVHWGHQNYPCTMPRPYL